VVSVLLLQPACTSGTTFRCQNCCRLCHVISLGLGKDSIEAYMAKLNEEAESRVWKILQQVLKVTDAATDVEFTLFANFGETS